MDKSNIIYYVTCLSFFGLILFVINHFFRKQPLYGLIVFSISPFAGLLVYLNYPTFAIPYSDWFSMVKLFSACIACVITFITILINPSSKLLFRLLRIIFVINILEACLRTLQIGEWMSSLSGVALIIAPTLWHSRIAKKSHSTTQQLEYDISYHWIYAYTLWNIVFVYVAYPSIFFLQVTVLSVPLLISAYYREIWAQSRVVTLSIWLVVNNTLHPVTSQFFQPSDFFKTSLSFYLQLITIIIILLLIITDKSCSNPTENDPLNHPFNR